MRQNPSDSEYPGHLRQPRTTAPALARGIAALRARRFAVADRELSETLADAALSDDRRAEILLLRSAARDKLGQARSASQDLMRVAELDPRMAPVVAERLAKLGLVEDALALLRAAGNHEALANLCLAVGRIGDSLAALRAAMHDDPKHGHTLSSWLRGLGDPEAALQALDSLQRGGAARERAALLCDVGRFAEARAELTVPSTIEDARLLLRAGAFAEATRLLVGLDDQEAAQLRGELASWTGDHERAIELADESPDGDRLRGGALLLIGRLDEAGAALARCLEREPGHAEALLWRGELARLRGDLDASLRDLDAGITASHGYPLAGHLSRLITVTEAHQRRGAQPHTTHPDAYAELMQLLEPVLEAPATKDGRRLTSELLGELGGALARMAGNRSTRPSHVVDGALRALDVPIHTRFAARTIQELIRVRPVAEVVSRLDQLAKQRSNEPTIYCHIGEIHLWTGDHDSADDAFRRALRDTIEVRWAYVGLCAVELIRGRLPEALAWCRRGEEAFPPPGRTMFAYRGEVYRRLGELERARADTRHMLSLTPKRLSSWINLALIEYQDGDKSLLSPAWVRIAKRAPGLVEDACRELSLDPLSPPEDERLFEHMLTMMRGNRSSNFVSYFTSEGELRFVPHQAAK
jgi:tetratricopeptide (TPR) repeat protein